jgi:hypothetical protein
MAHQLNLDYWIDATHLDAKDGEKVFKEEKKAVEALEDFIEDTEGCDDAAALAIADLVAVDMMLVDVAMDEVLCDGDRKCAKQMENAAKARAKADEKLAEGDAGSAITQLKNAWEFVQKAAKYAPSTRMETEFVLGTMQIDAPVMAGEVPVEFGLTGNYPNPFNPETTIGFEMPESAQVTLAVYDLLGRRVAMLVNGVLGAGKHTARFDASTPPSGGYIYRLTTPSGEFTKMMTLMK